MIWFLGAGAAPRFEAAAEELFLATCPGGIPRGSDSQLDWPDVYTTPLTAGTSGSVGTVGTVQSPSVTSKHRWMFVDRKAFGALGHLTLFLICLVDCWPYILEGLYMGLFEQYYEQDL